MSSARVGVIARDETSLSVSSSTASESVSSSDDPLDAEDVLRDVLREESSSLENSNSSGLFSEILGVLKLGSGVNSATRLIMSNWSRMLFKFVGMILRLKSGDSIESSLFKTNSRQPYSGFLLAAILL